MDAAETTRDADIKIIGGGIVGLAVLDAITSGTNLRCILVESSENLLSKASGSNTGIICTGVDAVGGSLERALIRDSISVVRGFCREMNIPMIECGSLVCSWPWDKIISGDNLDCSALKDIARQSWDAGDTHAKILSSKEVSTLEPNLVNNCYGAVHILGEIIVDPWLFGVALASRSRERGAVVHLNWEYDPSQTQYQQNLWTIFRKRSLKNADDEVTEASKISAHMVVNCTGIQADLVQELTKVAPKPRWEARPRRGQYLVFGRRSSFELHSSLNVLTEEDEKPYLLHPIQPIPTEHSKGIFVYRTIYDQIIVGPTATDQVSRTDNIPDPVVKQQLWEHARRIIPKLDEMYHPIGEYVGIRQGTNHRDYQICFYPRCNWIVASGIRSTGLTASLGIGRHILQSFVIPAFQHIVDASAQKDSSLHGRIMLSVRPCQPLPSLESMIDDFKGNNDGMVTINGHQYRVTHPVTRLGWSYYRSATCKTAPISNTM